jgi:hypothetical protein
MNVKIDKLTLGLPTITKIDGNKVHIACLGEVSGISKGYKEEPDSTGYERVLANTLDGFLKADPNDPTECNEISIRNESNSFEIRFDLSYLNDATSPHETAGYFTSGSDHFLLTGTDTAMRQNLNGNLFGYLFQDEIAKFVQLNEDNRKVLTQRSEEDFRTWDLYNCEIEIADDGKPEIVSGYFKADYTYDGDTFRDQNFVFSKDAVPNG